MGLILKFGLAPIVFETHQLNKVDLFYLENFVKQFDIHCDN